MTYNEIHGDLIKIAKEGKFDVISHGCNCFCQMGSGMAPQMASAFGCDEYDLEREECKGDINKLGMIDYMPYIVDPGGKVLVVVNSYTQYHYGHRNGPPLDYEALTLCMRKINHQFKGRHIGLPQIGAGLAGGDWERIKSIIQKELKDCQVTVVIYKRD